MLLQDTSYESVLVILKEIPYIGRYLVVSFVRDVPQRQFIPSNQTADCLNCNGADSLSGDGRLDDADDRGAAQGNQSALQNLVWPRTLQASEMACAMTVRAFADGERRRISLTSLTWHRRVARFCRNSGVKFKSRVVGR